MTDGKSIVPRALGSVHYLIAAGILLALAIGVNATLQAIGFVMAKAAVPLNSPLEELPEQFGERFELARVLTGDGILGGKVQLTDDVVKTLGTKDFISWIFIDRELSTPTVAAYVRFHVAYYTGILDATPHVPDNCMVASGFQPDSRYSGNVTWAVPGLSGSWKRHWETVSVRQRGFVSARGVRRVVYYVFSANGKPQGREGVRIMMSNPFTKHCYYMKIEISVSRDREPLTAEQIAEASEAFFAAAAPEIFKRIMSADEIKVLEDGR